MRMWQTIGCLWMVLAWILSGSPSAYAETNAVVRVGYPSAIGRREKPPRPPEALASHTGTPYIARLTRERTQGNGDATPPLAFLLPSVFTTHGLESGRVGPHPFGYIAVPRKTEDGSTGTRDPPFLR